MAIAYDNSADLGFTFTNTLTTAFTVGSETNRILFVGGWGGTTVGTDNWTGVTYNGVAMTRVYGFFNSTPGRWLYLYYLIAPATGSNNVVISASNTEGIDASASSYEDTADAITYGEYDSGQDGDGTIPMPLTTTLDNSWLIAIMHSGNAPTAGADTIRRNLGANGLTVFDSDGPKSPVGSYALNAVESPASGTGWIIASFGPVGSGGGLSTRKSLLGVGI